MKKIKEILLIISLVVVALCGFGGGFIFWFIISLIIKPSPQVFEIVFYISIFAPIPFCWWIAPKIGEKIL